MVLLSPRKLGLPWEGGFSEFEKRYFNLAFCSYNDWGRSKSEGRGLWDQNSLGTRADHSWCGWVNQGNIHSLAAVLGADDLCHSLWSGLTQQLPCRQREKHVLMSGVYRACMKVLVRIYSQGIILVSFSVLCVCVYVCVCTHLNLCCAYSLSRVRLFATTWTVARQAPLFMGSSRQEYWSGLPCPPPEDLYKPGIKTRSPALQADSLPSEPPGKP